MYLVLYVVAAYSKEFTEERCTTCFSGIKHFSPPFLKDSFSFLFLTITHSHTSDVCLLSLLLPTRSIRLSFPPFGGPSQYTSSGILPTPFSLGGGDFQKIQNYTSEGGLQISHAISASFYPLLNYPILSYTVINISKLTTILEIFLHSSGKNLEFGETGSARRKK